MAGVFKHPILVVDDEADILGSLRGLLRRDFDFHAAQNGYEGLKALERQRIDLVLSDQRMPDMTGVEFLARVRAQYPETMRLLFTGYSDIKAVVDAINKGNVYRYLSKPWDSDELLQVIRQACTDFERHAERKSLLNDLQSYLGQTMELVKKGKQETTGSSEAPPSAEQLAESGQALLDRLARVLS